MLVLYSIRYNHRHRFLLFEIIARDPLGKQGTSPREHVSTQGTLAREDVSTQDTLAHEHVTTQGTLAREHVRHAIWQALVEHYFHQCNLRFWSKSKSILNNKIRHLQIMLKN